MLCRDKHSEPRLTFASIFSLQRYEIHPAYRFTPEKQSGAHTTLCIVISVRNIESQLPANIQAEVDSRLAEIAKLLATIAPEIQGINRYRYSRSLMCLEELVEALTFAHYLKTQTLISHDQLSPIVEELARQGAASEDEAMTDARDMPAVPEKPPQAEAPIISLTQDDYLYGVFDLTGEMMRFATTSTALTGTMASGVTGDGDDRPRTIVQDMHELGSFFEMLPVVPGNRFAWGKKLNITRQSVQKVERLGYDRIIRGSERPKGWIPDLSSADQGQPEEPE